MKRISDSFTTLELTIIALFITLLYVSVLPFKLGLSKVPFIHAFFFSLPYTAVLVIGIHLVPKLGTTTLLIFGNSLFAQIISRGINPLWWPYALLPAIILEIYFLITRNYCATLMNTVLAGILRGAVVYLYFYLVAGPFIWHKFYADWYIVLQTTQGITGSALGGWIGYKLSKVIEKGFKLGGL